MNNNIETLWNLLIDKTYIISLEECGDRRDKLDIELKRINLINYEYILVQKDNEDTRRGCFNSHQIITKKCIENDFNRVLVLEDDAIFIEDLEKIKKILLNVFNYVENNNFSIFFLGHLPLTNLKKVNNNIVSTKDSRYTHCYIASKVGIKEINNLEYNNEHIDCVLQNIENKFACYPMISYQDDVITVNDFNFIYKIITKLRNKISCRNICRFFEIFHYYLPF
jgi:GR25 family glycosyltransferase involved in LPS biosynthesis